VEGLIGGNFERTELSNAFEIGREAQRKNAARQLFQMGDEKVKVLGACPSIRRRLLLILGQAPGEFIY